MTVPAWLQFTVAMTCLACFGAAQNGESGEVRVEQEQEAQRVKQGSADGGRGKGGKEEVIDDEKLTPEQRLARNIIAGAGSYCRFVGAIRPPKLMPGQTGTMWVTAVLHGAAVLPAPAPLEMLSPAQQGIVTLGGMSMRPAEPGRLASGYLGKPVYENTALLEIPVTMSSEAKLGQKHTVNIELKFDLYDGSSAQAIGRFLDHATAEIEVGLAADPAVAAAPRQPATSVAANQEPIVGTLPTTIPAKPANEVVAPGKTLVAVEPPTKTTGPEPLTSGTGPGPDVTEGDLPILPIAVGGVLLLAVVLLLARKK